jgi:hypothetical protein
MFPSHVTRNNLPQLTKVKTNVSRVTVLLIVTKREPNKQYEENVPLTGQFSTGNKRKMLIGLLKLQGKETDICCGYG